MRRSSRCYLRYQQKPATSEGMERDETQGEKICAHFRNSWDFFQRLFGIQKERERQNRIPRVGEGLATRGKAGSKVSGMLVNLSFIFKHEEINCRRKRSCVLGCTIDSGIDCQ